MFSKKTSILVVLLFILAAIVAYRIATKEEPKKVKELTYKPGVGAGLKPAPTETERPQQEGPKVKTEKKAYRGVIKNPFQALYPPPPPPVEAKPSPVLPPVPAPFSVITTKGPSPAQMESGKIKFIGFLQKEGDRKIFLSRDKEVFIVKKGDSVTIFQVADITDSSVTLISRDSNEEFKLIIEDVKPTKPGLLPGGGRR